MSSYRTMSTKCTICSKTAYPLESLSIGDKTYHKLCFRCTLLYNIQSHFLPLSSILGHECKNPLNQKTYKTVGGEIYCFTHTPVDRSTAMNSVANQSALSKSASFQESCLI